MKKEKGRRAEPRNTKAGELVTAALAALVLVAMSEGSSLNSVPLACEGRNKGSSIKARGTLLPNAL